MDYNTKNNHQLEINDLISDAITNAVTRRGLVVGLSDDEAAGVMGGLTSETTVTKLEPTDLDYPPIIAGMIALPDDEIGTIKPICEPIVVGLIAVDPIEEIA